MPKADGWGHAVDKSKPGVPSLLIQLSETTISLLSHKIKFMKKLCVAAIAAVLLSLVACSSSGSMGAGSWTFKGTTYSAYTGIGSTTAKTLTATTGSTSEVDNVVFHFTAYPPAAGNFTIVNTNPSTANQVYVIMNIGTKGYTVDASGSATCAVSVASDGKVSIVVPSVTFSNITGQAADSGPFTANINQNF